ALPTCAPRLVYEGGAWRSAGAARRAESEPHEGAPVPEIDERMSARHEPDRALLVLRGARASRSSSYDLVSVSAARFRGEEVVAATGGALTGRSGARLRREIVQI